MVSAETLLSFTDWKLSFIVHTDASDKQSGDFISQNNKPIPFFYRNLNKPQSKYTTTDKGLLAIVKCLKQFWGIIFGYEINVLSYHKNLFNAATLSEYKRVMRWRLIIEDFGPNIQHIDGIDNIVADKLSRMPSMPSDKCNTCTRKVQCCVNELFEIVGVEKNEDF